MKYISYSLVKNPSVNILIFPYLLHFSKHMNNLHISIQEAGSEISFDWKMITWKTTTTKMIFFPSAQEFTFPIRQIGSIRFYSDRNLRLKQVIIAIMLSFIGLASLSSSTIVGIIFLSIGWYILYDNFRSVKGINITTNWDKELIIFRGQENIIKAKELVSLANERIAEL